MGRSVAGSMDSRVSLERDLTNSLRMNRPFGCDQLWPFGAVKDVVQSFLAVLVVVNVREEDAIEGNNSLRFIAGCRALRDTLTCRCLQDHSIPSQVQIAWLLQIWSPSKALRSSCVCDVVVLLGRVSRSFVACKRVSSAISQKAILINKLHHHPTLPHHSPSAFEHISSDRVAIAFATPLGYCLYRGNISRTLATGQSHSEFSSE
jgi:hypothetical protein